MGGWMPARRRNGWLLFEPHFESDLSPTFRELDGAKRLQLEQQRQCKLQEQQSEKSGGSKFGWVQSRKEQWKERERVAAAQREREKREGELMEKKRALRRELQRLKKEGQGEEVGKGRGMV